MAALPVFPAQDRKDTLAGLDLVAAALVIAEEEVGYMAVAEVVAAVAVEMAAAVVVGLELVVIEAVSIGMVGLPVVEGPRRRSIQWRRCTWS